jgi:uncharacterized protein involved in response to NO
MMNNRNLQPFLLFSYAFRSLFLLAVIQAMVGISLWYLWFSGAVAIQWQVNPVYWHGHGMIMGLAGAAIAGFLLTAVATWTGRPVVRGWPLVLLCGFWLVARLELVLPLYAAIAAVLYWLWLLMLMAREVVSVANRRNYKVLLVLGVFLVLEALYYYTDLNQIAWQRQVIWSQIWLVVLMINLIGGRVIPAFTRNWLLKNHPDSEASQLPSAFGTLDIVASVALIGFAVATLLPVPPLIILGFSVATAALQFWRLLRWQGLRTLADPLVWMLHLSYVWIPLGVLLFGLGLAGYVSVSAGIHTLTIGAVAGMIVSVSARAALGHTGRLLTSHPLLTCSILLLALATLTRIAASLSDSSLLISVTAIFWICGFLCFAIRYVPVLVKPAIV